MTKQAIDELFNGAVSRAAFELKSETILLYEDDFNHVRKTAFNDGFIAGCIDMNEFIIRFMENATLTIRLDK